MELAIKIDVDTDRGTRVGVPNLCRLFTQHEIQATFLFSMGPDNTGRALKRIFRPGFLKKVSRTSVLQVYGFKTLLNGVLWPGPNIARRNIGVMQQTYRDGHEVGIHCYDHVKWQDYLDKMSYPAVVKELSQARDAFYSVFHFSAQTAGSAGWQANHHSLQAYDEAQFIYGSDARGITPFYPVINGKTYHTLQLPTTLPTLDELIGRPEYPLSSLTDRYISLMKEDRLNTLTIHAELEGMAYLTWFSSFLEQIKQRGITCVTLRYIADRLLASNQIIPCCPLIQGTVDGRSGTLAVQGEPFLRS